MALLGLLVGVVGAEVAVRAWVYYARQDAERYDLAAGTFELVPGRYPVVAGEVVVNDDGFVGRPLRGAAGSRKRIVALGDSCTFGGGNGRDSYPDMLEARLSQRAGPDAYEVVNAAISGLDTDQTRRRLISRVAPLEPDIALLYVGWNDLGKKSPWHQRSDGAVARALAWLDGLWLVRGARKLAFRHVRSRWKDPAVGPESRTGRFRYYVPEGFAADLRALVEAAREAGAAPVLLTLPSPLRASYGVADLRRGRITFPYVAGTYAVGDYLDLIAAYNQVIRTVARDLRVPVVDLVEAFAGRSRPEDYFHDAMHPNQKGMDVIARAVERKLASEGLL